MSEVFETLQRRYRDLVARSEAGKSDEDLLESIRLFLSDARKAGAMVVDPAERGQLRAYMRFLAALLGEAGQEIPEVDLLPPDRERWPEPPPPPAGTAAVPAWVWGLAGAAALVVLAGLVAVASFSAGAIAVGPTATPLPPTPTPRPSPTPSPTSSPTPTPTPPPTPTPVPAAFSDLTVALGVLGSGEPFLVGDTFDWNTKAVYAVFDYVGMRDGLEWSVVWTRNGEEVARESHFWDEGQDGQAGTYWVAYFNPEGTVLRGGDYTVSLYIEGELQAEAAFRIRYYVPRE